MAPLAALLIVSRLAIPERILGEPALGVQRALREFQDKNGIPGLCLTVSLGGKLLYCFQRGFADRSRGLVFGTSTRFALGTSSKVLTSLAVLHLLDAKGIDLDAPAMRYLKLTDTSAKRQIGSGDYTKISFRNLLEHSAGFGPEFNAWSRSEVAKAYGSEMPSTARQNVQFGLRRPLTYAPGSKMRFSNFDYLVLGRLIEDLSGRSYPDYVSETVLKPLQLQRMALRHSAPGKRLSDETQYDEPKGALYPAVYGPPPGKPVTMMQGGAAYEMADATAGWAGDSMDLARLISAFRTEKIARILSPRMQMEIIRRPQSAGDLRSFAAMGVEVEVAEDGSGVAIRSMGDLPGDAVILASNYEGVCFTLAMNKGMADRELSREIFNDLSDAIAIESWAGRKPLLSF